MIDVKKRIPFEQYEERKNLIAKRITSNLRSILEAPSISIDEKIEEICLVMENSIRELMLLVTEAPMNAFLE